MTIALIGTPKRCSAFALDRERRSSRQAPSPPSITCLENFSLPGLLIVTTHFDLLNSSEANIVVSFARAVVATTVAEVTKCIGCLHAGVEDQPTKSGRRPPGIGSVPPCQQAESPAPLPCLSQKSFLFQRLERKCLCGSRASLQGDYSPC